MHRSYTGRRACSSLSCVLCDKMHTVKPSMLGRMVVPRRAHTAKQKQEMLSRRPMHRSSLVHGNSRDIPDFHIPSHPRIPPAVPSTSPAVLKLSLLKVGCLHSRSFRGLRDMSGLAGLTVFALLLRMAARGDIEPQMWEADAISAVFHSLCDISSTYEVIGGGTDMDFKARSRGPERFQLATC
jgi:hypothetical protein